MCNKLKYNALPVRSRTRKGRVQLDRSCRAGCRAPETLNHVIQQCHRTHGARIDRHNSVASYLQRNLQNKGWTTSSEPITDSFDLDRANQNKVNKYSTMDYKRALREKFRTSEERTIAATLNWRGIWSAESPKQLLDQQIIRNQELQLLSTRVLIGGVIGHTIFLQSTMTRTGRLDQKTQQRCMKKRPRRKKSDHQ